MTIIPFVVGLALGLSALLIYRLGRKHGLRAKRDEYVRGFHVGAVWQMTKDEPKWNGVMCHSIQLPQHLIEQMKPGKIGGNLPYNA